MVYTQIYSKSLYSTKMTSILNVEMVQSYNSHVPNVALITL